MIDLHCHSIFSDGLLTPKQLLEQAFCSGVELLSLTDHDTLDGMYELIQESIHYPSIKIINGIELSARWKKYDIHILGLYVSLDNCNLLELVKNQSELRIIRAKMISEKLHQFGVTDAYEKACAIAGHNRVGRPHFAQILIQEGLVVDVKTAFKRYLGQNKMAYVATNWLDISDIVKTINIAGGKAVIAHPLKYGLTRTKLIELICDFKDAGGLGIEVVSGEMTSTQILEATGFSLRYDLLASTGSDYHGPNMSRVGLGKQALLPDQCKPLWTK